MKVKVILLTLAFTLIFSNIMVFGESMFTDIDDDHWSYEYVKKVVDLGLMNGYDDATFRPRKPVNTADALVYVTRLFDLDEEEVKQMREKYDILLDNYDLSEDRKDAIAIALSKGVVTQLFIENNLFMEDEIRKVNKTELSIYIAKAMDMEKGEEGALIFLYNDLDDIQESARPYIKFLINKGVLGETGDANGNFNPDEPVIRSVLAKMLSIAYDQMNENTVIDPEEPEDDEPIEKSPIIDEEEYEEIAGTIVLKMEDLIFIAKGQQVDAYNLAEDIEITISDEDSSTDMLEEGMNIKALATDDNILKAVNVDNTNDIINGNIEEIYLGPNPYIVVEIDDEESKTLNLSRDPEVVIDGSESRLYSLKEGDLVIVEAFEDDVLSIVAESKDGKVKGRIEDKIFDDDRSLLLVEREDGSIYQYIVDENTTINRNSNGVTVDDLRIGDELVLSIADGDTNLIDAKSVPGEDEGYIESILIADESKLTIIDDEGDTTSYYISKDVDITTDEEDEEKMDIYDLRLDDFVNLELESDEIVNIKIQK